MYKYCVKFNIYKYIKYNIHEYKCIIVLINI